MENNCSFLTQAEENLMTSLNQLKNHDLEDEILLKLTEMQELSRRVSMYKDPELDEPAIKLDEELEENE